LAGALAIFIYKPKGKIQKSKDWTLQSPQPSNVAAPDWRFLQIRGYRHAGTKCRLSTIHYLISIEF